MFKNLKLCIIICFLLLPATAYSFGSHSRGFFNSFPAPRMIYPITDKVDLGGKDLLQFKWWISDYTDADYYDFRLYKGYNTYADNLILKQKIPAKETTFEVKADTFQDGQVYTWTLKQVLEGAEKSETNYCSFTVNKQVKAQRIGN